MRVFFDRLHTTLLRHSDLALAAGVVLIVALIVIRVPPDAIDWLIGLNIALAAIVMLSALYVADAAKLPAFPTILLLATLFRLGLNISTTRLILLEADAGQVIDAFGQFVVGGDLIVGLVVFLVIVMVQFIVIAKGSERVAEVAARFTLDAMPGKQMSIDADLDAGLLTPEQARLARRSLEQENKLYGAMDGAMKFVKGDAIAGLAISAVNLLGGLAIGTLRQGLSPGDALETYALLTVGDGLVAQIPALLISVAAGLIVTRVAGDTGVGAGRAAGEIVDQVLAQPRALAVAAVVLAGMAALPGFPPPVFLTLGVLAAGAAVMGFLRPSHAVGIADASLVQDARARRKLAVEALGDGPEPLDIELQGALAAAAFDPDRQGQPIAHPAFTAALEATCATLEQDWGVPLPRPILHPPASDDHAAAQDDYRIRLYGSTADRGVLPGRHVLLAPTSEDALEAMRTIASEPPITLPWCRAQTWPVLPDQADAVLAGLDPALRPHVRVIPPEQALARQLRHVLERRIDAFLGVQLASDLLARVAAAEPDLAAAVSPDPLSPAQLAELLRALVRDGVPVADLRGVLESLAEHAPRLRSDPTPIAELAALVRQDRSRSLAARLAGGQGDLPFYAVDDAIEAACAQALAPGAHALTLDFETRREVLDAFLDAVPPWRHVDRPAVIAVSRPSLRLPLANLLAPYLPEAWVVGYPDLPAEAGPLQTGLVMVGAHDPA
ncbi:MAG: flagellar biosynthesis protein FlhA [Planctomycetota bacterium]